MTSEEIANALLRWFGENPDAYPQLDDKWPAIAAMVFLYSLPVIFGLLVLFPFFWIWHKKKKFTLKNLGKAFLQAIGLVALGILALFLLISWLQGQAFQALYGV